MPTPALILDGQPLEVEDVIAVAREGDTVGLGPSARLAIERSRTVVESVLKDGEAHYGINTGFGSLARTRIASDRLADLQANLVRSHAAGVGEPLPDEVVRGMMLLLAASLCRGRSGVRVGVPDLLCSLLNAGITPIVPSVGSVGASGDLAPLAHCALTLIGEGHVRVGGQVMESSRALAEAGLVPLALQAKEGLALINGTHLMAAEAALLCADARTLLQSACVACCMSIDGMKGTDASLDPRVYELRGHPGPQRVASLMLALLAGSSVITSHAENDPRVQDPYSLRCAPQVLGAAWDCLDYVRSATLRELSAVTDNPLVFSDDPQIVSAGNFHGMPIAIPLDSLSIAISHIAGIAERRVYLMLAARDPEAGLQPYLAKQPGLQSGLMIAQYTAAACCNELIGLATPASVANLPTSAGTEDYNSFGPRSAAKARRGLELAQQVVAIELICAAEALDAQHDHGLHSGAGVELAHERIRKLVPQLEHDRPPAPDIAAVAQAVAEGRFVIDELLGRGAVG